MRQYWWVNHKQTSRHEIGGGYLWSPKKDAVGNSARYRNMLRAKPDDLVLSYAHAQIGNVGRVADFAFADPRPDEFGRTGDRWEVAGWRLPVLWTPVTPPVKTKPFFKELRPLFMEGLPPINAIGNGEQGVYLAEIGEPAFRRTLRDAAYDAEWLNKADPSRVAFEAVKEVEEEQIAKAINEDPSLEATMKLQLQHGRRGQGIFRERVRALGSQCRITGVSNHWLLIASHIKPWRFCSNSIERLDGANGLMLTPDCDLLFDRGFISFRDDGRVMVSPNLDNEIVSKLKLEGLDGFPTGPFTPQQAHYLAWHREQVFKK